MFMPLSTFYHVLGQVQVYMKTAPIYTQMEAFKQNNCEVKVYLTTSK